MATSNGWKTVTFNEGAPLDPVDLNQLQLGLSDLFTQTTSFYNATKDTTGKNRVAVVDGGTESVTLNGKANVPTQVGPIQFTSTFINGQEIYFTGSFGQTPTGYGVVSVAAEVISGTLSGYLYVTTSIAKAGTVKVNWLAAQLKDI